MKYDFSVPQDLGSKNERLNLAVDHVFDGSLLKAFFPNTNIEYSIGDT